MPIRALDQLIRDDAERLALRSNGFVCSEERSYCQVYKLRFRVAGRQRVRYVGSAAAADQIRQELAVWQAGTRAKRALRQAQHEARRAIRQIKPYLAPLVQAAGLKFHGRAIRRPRRRIAKPMATS